MLDFIMGLCGALLLHSFTGAFLEIMFVIYFSNNNEMLSFLGCDSTSSFYGKGKVTALKVARNKDEYANTFANLGVCVPPPADLINEIMKYVCHLYGHGNESDVNLVRYQVFKSEKFEEELYLGSLAVHVKRAAYQSQQLCLILSLEISLSMGVGLTKKAWST